MFNRQLHLLCSTTDNNVKY